MTDETGREPPKSAIMAGYNMMKAREGALSQGGYYQQYLAHAIDCTVVATKELADDGLIHYFDGAAVLAILHESAATLGNPKTTYHEWLAAANNIGKAHRLAARIMRQSNHRTITARDFAKLGSGGAR